MGADDRRLVPESTGEAEGRQARGCEAARSRVRRPLEDGPCGACPAAGIEAITLTQSQETDKLPRYCHQLCSLHKLAIETGVTVKEAQELAGHSTPELTLNTYGRVREARLKEAAVERGTC